jgi:hypothetical protein
VVILYVLLVAIPSLFTSTFTVVVSIAASAVLIEALAWELVQAVDSNAEEGVVTVVSLVNDAPLLSIGGKINVVSFP